MSKRNRAGFSSLSTTQLVKLHMLHLLSTGDRYGQNIIDEIEERLKGKWKPSPGMIYPLLRQFEDKGYVRGTWESKSKRTIRIYSLTEEGYKHLESVKKNYIEKLENSRKIIDLTIKHVY